MHLILAFLLFRSCLVNELSSKIELISGNFFQNNQNFIKLASNDDFKIIPKPSLKLQKPLSFKASNSNKAFLSLALL